MKQIKQSSTSYPVVFFMTDSADHVTGKTSLAPTVTLSKNGAAFGSAAGAVSEIGGGWYALAGNATDRDTLGSLAVHAAATGADPFDGLYDVVGFDPYIYGANLDAAVSTRLAATSYTAPDYTIVTAIKAKTDNLPSDPASETTTTAAILAALSSVDVTVTSPVTAAGTITIYAGDDYQYADGRSIDWTIADLGSTAGVTASFTMRGLTKALTVVDTTTIRMELTHTETAALAAGQYDYRMTVTDAGGHVATVIEGGITVR